MNDEHAEILAGEIVKTKGCAVFLAHRPERPMEKVSCQRVAVGRSGAEPGHSNQNRRGERFVSPHSMANLLAAAQVHFRAYMLIAWDTSRPIQPRHPDHKLRIDRGAGSKDPAPLNVSNRGWAKDTGRWHGCDIHDYEWHGYESAGWDPTFWQKDKKG